MASEWDCKILGEELGPFSFQDLVDLVRNGNLARDDLVRRHGTTDWGRADAVIGLFRAAESATVPLLSKWWNQSGSWRPCG